MNPTKRQKNGKRGTRSAPPTNAFKVGNKGGPGRTPMAPDLKAALVADSLDIYIEAKALYVEAKDAGDFSTAGKLIIALLKKVAPDTSAILVAGADGGPLQPIDLSRLPTSAVEAIVAEQKRMAEAAAEKKLDS